MDSPPPGVRHCFSASPAMTERAYSDRATGIRNQGNFSALHGFAHFVLSLEFQLFAR
jgi:hypothetical protein